MVLDLAEVTDFVTALFEARPTAIFCYCTDCNKVVYRGGNNREALDARDVHEFERKHTVLKYVEIGRHLLLVTQEIRL